MIAPTPHVRPLRQAKAPTLYLPRGLSRQDALKQMAYWKLRRHEVRARPPREFPSAFLIDCPGCGCDLVHHTKYASVREGRIDMCALTNYHMRHEVRSQWRCLKCQIACDKHLSVLPMK